MELLALVIINIFSGVILYYAVSIKVTNSVRDYQIVKLKKEIQAHTLSFFKESESYLALMDSRIAVLKNLLQKAETMGVDFQNYPDTENIGNKNPSYQDSGNTQSDTSTQESSKKPIDQYIATNVQERKLPTTKTAKQKDESNTDSFVGGFIAGLGKGLKSMFGVKDEVFSSFEREPNTKSGKNSVIDVSVGGNPLDSDEIVRDNLRVNDGFKAALAQANNSYSNSPKDQDKILISISTVLEELPADATKVEKVVYLLKKGYSHSDISDEMGLAIPEISLIETIKIERSRRV